MARLQAIENRLAAVLVAADKFTMKRLEDFAGDASEATMAAADAAISMQERITALANRTRMARLLSEMNREVVEVARTPR